MKQEDKIRIASLSIAIMGLLYFFLRVPGCGSQELGVQQVEPNPSIPPVSECNKVTFKEVTPLLSQKCESCHSGYSSYQTAKGKVDQYIARVSLPDNNPLRMPKAAPALGQAEKDLLLKWKVDGLLESCSGVAPAPKKKVVFNEAETAMLQAVNSLDVVDRVQTRFILATNKDDLEKYQAAANKAINSLNSVERKLVKAKEVLGGTILQIRLEDFGLNATDWEKIIAADPLKLESFTNTGVILKQLTNTRRPWIEVANFIDVTFRNSRLYYDLTRTPGTFGELIRKLGVDFAGDLKDFRAFLIGEANSVLSLGKNRLVARFKSVDGYFWQTFDPLALNGVEQRNLFRFPLLAQAGGKANFDFAASEAIYTLPNGMQGYVLFNAQGVRQNAAPQNIVQDNSGQNPKGSEIVNASSCTRCHNQGIIPLSDGVRDSVIQNAVLFDARDVEIVKRLYKDNQVNRSLFEEDNRFHGQKLSEIGVKEGPDPMVFATDRLLLNWNLAQLAEYLFFSKEEFQVLLAQSATGRSELGQLLVGGTVTYDQIIASLPKVIQELRIFQDELGK
jgi:hypothetical protein